MRPGLGEAARHVKLLRKVWRIGAVAGTTFFMDGKEVYYWSRTVTAEPSRDGLSGAEGS